MLIVKFGEEGNARGIIDSKGENRWCWRVRVDDDLTMKERRRR